MDVYSSAEDQNTKIRKPYTITKQRERWTEDEHNRFLEALKLYGRAWQRIEEHIGTKTAVQIRSHAQKFFSKLEKEALINGTPLGQTHEIDIPPPRPKRKPSNPYPRKTSAGAPNSSIVGLKDVDLLNSTSSCPAKQTVDAEHDTPPERPGETKISTKAKASLGKNNGSEILNLFHEAPCSSISSDSKSSPTSNPCVFREFILSVKEVSNQVGEDESHLSRKCGDSKKFNQTDSEYSNQDNGTSGMSGARNLDHCSHKTFEKMVERERTDEKQPKKLNLLSLEVSEADQTYPRHIPVNVVDSTSRTCLQTPEAELTYPASTIHKAERVQGNPNLFTNPCASATEHQSHISTQLLPNFAFPFIPAINNEDCYRSFLNANFSSLIVSTLLHNPAAHAAACFAASFWPCMNMENSAGSPLGSTKEYPLEQGNSPQSMAAIAAATVAAASAWWASHGLLPMCPPLPSGFVSISAPTTETSSDANQDLRVDSNSSFKDPPESQRCDPELLESFKPEGTDAKFLPPQSSDYEESRGVPLSNTELEAAGNKQKPVPGTGLHGCDKGKTRGQVDPSSCGSNTTSSSEIETDKLEKHADCLEGSKENINHWNSEPNNYRGRSTSNVNESWKEVSMEGKLAFKALFSREVLPQSFSPPQNLRNNLQPQNSDEEQLKSEEKSEKDNLQLDINSNTLGTCLDHQEVEEGEFSSSNTKKELLFMGLGHVKFKTHRTGFKPYKRCSVDSKESRITKGSDEGGERDLKRMRLGEALT